jgi:hypothetical protein
MSKQQVESRRQVQRSQRSQMFQRFQRGSCGRDKVYAKTMRNNSFLHGDKGWCLLYHAWGITAIREQDPGLKSLNLQNTRNEYPYRYDVLYFRIFIF